jgi:hypothetical protein
MPASRHAPPSNAPTHHGAGPYRDAPLSLPRRPAAPRRGVGLLGAAVVTFGLVRALHRPTQPPVSAPSLYIERASSLAGGARITAVFSDRDAQHPDVLRIPGTAVRRGADTVVTPEVLAGHGAVAAVPDGEHFIDEHGAWLRVRDGVVAPLPGAEVAPFAVGELLPAGARVVQRAGDFARMDNGGLFALRNAISARPALASRSLVRDVATDGEVVCALEPADRVVCARARHWEAPTGPNTPDMWAHPVWIEAEPLTGHQAEQVVVGGRVACVRDRGGGVFCAMLNLPRHTAEILWLYGTHVPLPWMGDAPRATKVAISRDDLCVLGADRRLRCVHGPAEDAGAPLAITPLRLRDAMDGVDEVALTTDLGCARRGGRIDCWGPLARGGWVSRRERPARVAGLRDVSSLLASNGLVCALARGEVRCWGVGPEGVRRPVPIQVTLPAAAERIEHTARDGVCAWLEGQQTLCWRDVGPEANPRYAPQPPLPLAAVPIRAVADPAANEPPPRAEGLDDVAQVVVARGLACARRRGGEVWCWGDNASGALTVAEADRSPRVVTLRR